MSPELRAALFAAAKAFAETPEGKKLIAKGEQLVLDNLPGVEGTALRFIHACLPHDVVSIGLRRDGPG